MICVGTNILVEFTEDRTMKNLGNGVHIHIPERSYYDTVEGSDYTSRITDRKFINPQLAIVKAENENYPHLKIGDMIFLHYGAYEGRYPCKEGGSFVNAQMIFFKLENNKFIPAEGIFIAKQLFKEAPRTMSGILLTPDVSEKQKCQVEIIAVPENENVISVGDVVYTIDDHQYVFEYNGDKYVKLSAEYVVSKKVA
jgi:co-chaperonin GroES (HSP10)